MDRFAVADVLEEIAAHLEFRGENPFKTRAYLNGARLLRDLEVDLRTLVHTGELRQQPGIGPALADKITTLVSTGALPYLDQLRAATPPELLAWLRIAGLGPRKALAIHEALGIRTFDELEEACRAGRVRGLRGMGPALEARILQGIGRARSGTARVLMPAGHAEAARLLALVRGLSGVVRAETAGEVRRCLEVVSAIDLVAGARHPGAVLDAFAALTPVREVVERTAQGCRARLASGLPVSLRAVPDAAFAVTLLEATGSDAHLALLRARAGARDLAGPDEAAVYAALGLPWIPPELREGAGEIEAAQAGALPRLIERDDLQGLIHVHSDWSDGRVSIAGMAEAARELGYRYLALCDHSRSAGYAGGLSVDRVREQHAAIEAVNARGDGAFRLLKGIEVDILPDGTLDFEDEVLASFELVVASIHSRFSLSEEEQTVRVLRALDNPYVDVLGHPTGRLLLTRPPYAIDLAAVLGAATSRGIAVEVNAHPNRLDLDWRALRPGLAGGLLTSIDPDAHTRQELQGVTWGVAVARKGWCTAEHALCAWPLPRLLEHLARRRRQAMR